MKMKPFCFLLNLTPIEQTALLESCIKYCLHLSQGTIVSTFDTHNEESQTLTEIQVPF